MGFFQAFGTFLYERVWLSKKSTILGLLVFALGETLNYLGQLPSIPVNVHLVITAITSVFILWRDQAVKDGKIALFAIIFLFLPGVAQAQGSPTARRASAEALAGAISQDPNAVPPDVMPAPAPSPFGGCVGVRKNVCFGPSAVVGLVAINLSSKKVEGAFSPGVGYGFTVNPGKWSSFGADAFFVVDPGAQQVSGSLVLKLINGYLRVGVSKGFIGDVSWRIPVGLGVDL